SDRRRPREAGTSPPLRVASFDRTDEALAAGLAIGLDGGAMALLGLAPQRLEGGRPADGIEPRVPRHQGGDVVAAVDRAGEKVHPLLDRPGANQVPRREEDSLRIVETAVEDDLRVAHARFPVALDPGAQRAEQRSLV